MCTLKLRLYDSAINLLILQIRELDAVEMLKWAEGHISCITSLEDIFPSYLHTQK